MKTKNISSTLRYAVAMAFALASSYAVGDTPTTTPTPCGIPYTPTPAPNCSNHPTFTVNVCAHDGYELVTNVYLKPGNPTPRLPVLVMRGGILGVAPRTRPMRIITWSSKTSGPDLES